MYGNYQQQELGTYSWRVAKGLAADNWQSMSPRHSAVVEIPQYPGAWQQSSRAAEQESVSATLECGKCIRHTLDAVLRVVALLE
jgi:hypothetical protein